MYTVGWDTGGVIYFECLLPPGTVLGLHGKEAASGLALTVGYTQVHTPAWGAQTRLWER